MFVINGLFKCVIFTVCTCICWLVANGNIYLTRCQCVQFIQYYDGMSLEPYIGEMPINQVKLLLACSQVEVGR